MDIETSVVRLPGAPVEVQFAHLSYQEFLAADFLCTAWTETAKDSDWLIACAGLSWWSACGAMEARGGGFRRLGLPCRDSREGELARSQVLLMLVELLPDSGELFEALSQDPDAQLRIGQHAHITYGASMIKVSKTRAVRVAALKSNSAVVVPKAACWKSAIAVPRGAVYLPEHGVGVLLLAAARAGSVQVVRGLAARGLHLGFVDGNDNTALHLCLLHEHEECVLELLRQGDGDHPLKRNVAWCTPGKLAAQSAVALPAAFRALNPSPGDKDACAIRKPLMVAARAGDVDAVRSLVASEALEDAVATPRHCTALSVAAENGRAEVVRVLAEHKADVNCRSSAKKSPALFWASYYMHDETIAASLAAGAVINAADSNGFTALHAASFVGSLAICRRLLAAHAYVHCKTTRASSAGAKGTMPLHVAAGNGHAAVARELLGARANPDGRAAWPGDFTAVHCACLSYGEAAGEIVRALVEGRANLNAIASLPLHFSPLQSAALFNNAVVTEALLQARADASIRRTGVHMIHATARDVAERWDRCDVLAVFDHFDGQA